ncbi:MAG: thioredoxin family protein [Psychrilyobacter sp.]|uniref:thioredoxin family protein n=1 Tax=Psychrilyobacter sp. TaxID=2586924 RepID=UPI003C7958E7
MRFKELFEVGQTFENYIKTATENETERIPKNYSRIKLSEELIKEIKEIQGKVYILASGEMWCPDCQLNITVAKKLTEINDNIKLSIISMGRGRKYLMTLLNLEEFKIPTMVILDKNFNQIGLFLEQPKSVKKLEKNAENELSYLKGNYLTDTALELVHLIKG